ncbi:MAG: hypothetical protein QOI66_506 [Myxococcales bacterium]|nr:hypothetical protein [Myxococcales bacterium]
MRRRRQRPRPHAGCLWAWAAAGRASSAWRTHRHHPSRRRRHRPRTHRRRSWTQCHPLDRSAARPRLCLRSLVAPRQQRCMRSQVAPRQQRCVHSQWAPALSPRLGCWRNPKGACHRHRHRLRSLPARWRQPRCRPRRPLWSVHRFRRCRWCRPRRQLPRRFRRPRFARGERPFLLFRRRRKVRLRPRIAPGPFLRPPRPRCLQQDLSARFSPPIRGAKK